MIKDILDKMADVFYKVPIGGMRGRKQVRTEIHLHHSEPLNPLDIITALYLHTKLIMKRQGLTKLEFDPSSISLCDEREANFLRLTSHVSSRHIYEFTNFEPYVSPEMAMYAPQRERSP